MPLPAWATDPSSLLITEEEYQALPAELPEGVKIDVRFVGLERV